MGIKEIKVLTIFGTRPEAIKMAPLVKQLERGEGIQSLVCVTAQHRQMLDQVLDIFQIRPEYDLNVMQERQTLIQVTARVLEGLDDVLKKERPDIVLVHGDTSTTFVAGLAAFYNQIAIGHVEAGLRTYNKNSPYPEEMNRQLTGVLTDLHFAPTTLAAGNLRNEGKPEEHIFVTGNTVIDALKTTVKENYHHPVLEQIGDHKLILMTAHRRENLGEKMMGMFRGILRLIEEHSNVSLVYPVHLNPAIQEAAQEVLGSHPRIHLISPLDAIDFHNIMFRSHLILTDSGGIQEEAPAFGVPVLVLRDTTERPEGVEAGTLKLAGTREEDIYQMAHTLLTQPEEYDKMAKAANPYGDGEASRRIVHAIQYHYGLRTDKPDSFYPTKPNP